MILYPDVALQSSVKSLVGLLTGWILLHIAKMTTN